MVSRIVRAEGPPHKIIERAFSPSVFSCPGFLGRCPRLILGAPSALGIRILPKNKNPGDGYHRFHRAAVNTTELNRRFSILLIQWSVSASISQSGAAIFAAAITIAIPIPMCFGCGVLPFSVALEEEGRVADLGIKRDVFSENSCRRVVGLNPSHQGAAVVPAERLRAELRSRPVH